LGPRGSLPDERNKTLASRQAERYIEALNMGRTEGRVTAGTNFSGDYILDFGNSTWELRWATTAPGAIQYDLREIEAGQTVPAGVTHVTFVTPQQAAVERFAGYRPEANELHVALPQGYSPQQVLQGLRAEHQQNGTNPHVPVAPRQPQAASGGLREWAREHPVELWIGVGVAAAIGAGVTLGTGGAATGPVMTGVRFAAALLGGI
jgi:hypothetical protein